MSLNELLPSIQALPREEKLHLIQLLTEEVAREEGIMLDLAGKAVPIWTPYDAFEGAAALLRALEEERASS